MSRIRLVATDLDGTLIGSTNEIPLYTSFRDKLNELRRDNGAVWVACTGRPLASFKEFFFPMRMMGLQPEFIILRHAYVYGLTRLGYLPHIFWNLHIMYLLWSDQLYVREAIDQWHDMIRAGAAGVTTVSRRRDRLCLRFDSEDSARVATELLRDKVKQYRHLKVFLYSREVDVRSVPFTKGLALTELANHLEIRPEEILAIGNGHNDISMLDGTTARLTGCPVNSEPEVMETVHRAGGHVASKRCLAGVLEILDAYEKNTVCSDLPAWWEDPSHNRNPKPRRSRSRRRKKVRSAGLWLSIAATYVVLTVFASFGLIPFSGIIMKPYRLLGVFVERIVRMFI